MADPKLDTDKLGVVIDWAKDLIDELSERADLLPCKNLERVEDCISRQKHYLVGEMKPTKMCPRCRARWHLMVALSVMFVHIGRVLSTPRD